MHEGLLVLGGFIYIFGKVGMDLLSAYLSHLYGQISMLYIASATLEGVLEMIGSIIFVKFFLVYISSELKTININSAQQTENHS